MPFHNPRPGIFPKNFELSSRHTTLGMVEVEEQSNSGGKRNRGRNLPPTYSSHRDAVSGAIEFGLIAKQPVTFLCK
jgi:hypothetical protein